MRHAAESDQALVVALLVAIVDRRAGKEAAAVVLVGALRGDAHVGQPREAAVGGAREEDVGRKPGRVVVGEGRVAAGRIHGQPLIETVVSSGRLADHRWRCRPARPGVVGGREENGGVADRVQIHPGAIEPAAVRATRAVGVAGGINQGPANRFRRDADIEGDHLQGDRALGAPRDSAVE